MLDRLERGLTLAGNDQVENSILITSAGLRLVGVDRDALLALAVLRVGRLLMVRLLARPTVRRRGRWLLLWMRLHNHHLRKRIVVGLVYRKKRPLRI